VSKISWFTFLVATYYGLKNFSFYYFLAGIIFSILMVEFSFWKFSLFIRDKINDEEKLVKIKTVLEYLIIIIIIKYIFF